MLTYPKAILLDWDSTLVDSWNGIVAAWNHALAQLDRPATMTRADAIRLSSLPHNELFLQVFGADDAQSGASLLYRHLAGLGMAGLSILPGSLDLLEGLQALAIPVAIVSNKQGPIVAAEIAYLGWQDYVFASVGAGDAAYDKPHPAPLLYALEQRMIAPAADVWMVGDMHSDMQAGHRAGVTTVFMETTSSLGLGLEGDLTRYPPAARVRDAGALLDLVKSLPRTT